MSYCRFDDRFASDPNAFMLSDEACGMLLRAHTWIAGQLTDGWIEPPFMVQHVRTRKQKRTVEELVQKGWWQHQEGGRYYSVTYLQDNPTREEVESKIAGARQRRENYERRRAQGTLPWEPGTATA